MTVKGSPAAGSTQLPPSTTTTTPWQSPMPYLFGGLAAMLGLIAFALLILACSYWRLSGRLRSSAEAGRRDLETGNEKDGISSGDTHKGSNDDQILVIMAGNHKPTFLATPVSTKASSFVDKNAIFSDEAAKETEIGGKIKQNSTSSHLETTTTTTTTTTTITDADAAAAAAATEEEQWATQETQQNH